MTLDELKSIFQSYCCKEAGSPEKKLFGMEYENFVMIPKGHDKEKTFDPLPAYILGIHCPQPLFLECF